MGEHPYRYWAGNPFPNIGEVGKRYANADYSRNWDCGFSPYFIYHKKKEDNYEPR